MSERARDQPAPAPLKRSAGRLLLTGAFVLGFAGLSTWVRTDVAGMERFGVDVAALSFGAPPSFLSPQAASDLENLPVASDAASSFDDRLVVRIAAALDALPWVKAVESARLSYPNRVAVRFSVLEPVAAVEARGRRAAVSASGRLFPGRYVAPEVDERLPTLVGIAEAPDQVMVCEAALGLVNALRERDLLARAGVRELRLRNYNGRVDPRASEIVMACASGAVIEWGRDEDARGLSLDFDTKARRLETLLRRYPGLAGLKRASLRWDQLIVETAAEADQEPRGG